MSAADQISFLDERLISSHALSGDRVEDQVDTASSVRSTEVTDQESATAASSTFSSRPSTPPSEAGFRRWRPGYHVIASRGWLNDPCAPGYDPQTGIYSLGFQWNPYDYKWGNMSWGSTVSTDFANWHVSESPAMEPTKTMDQCGVFTGCMLQKDHITDDTSEAVKGDFTTNIAFYTSAQKLPITFKQPYTRGSEQLHMATSTDNGRSWTRAESNTILSEPPTELGDSVRGWRDPFVAPWKALDRALGRNHSQPGLYGIISGSIHGKTPTVFLYELDRKDVCCWKSLGPINDIPVNFSPSPWSGDFGVNWEVANFVDLVDPDGVAYSILIVGVEGVQTRPGDPLRSELVREHKQMWMCGSLEQHGKGVRMQYNFGGTLDHGCYYASNGFNDPVTGNFVTFGWIFEEDLSPTRVAQQGWSGCLSIPRVISMKSLNYVTAALKTNIGDISSIDSLEDNGIHTLKVLGVTPDPRLALLRNLELHVDITDQVTWFEESMKRHFEFQASFGVTDSSIVGVDIAHDEDFATFTSILFDPAEETVTIDRSRSTTDTEINTSPEEAKHTLFSFADGTSETLDLRVFYDVSVLEVFVNDRTAIATRIYPQSRKCFGARWIRSNSTGPSSDNDGHHPQQQLTSEYDARNEQPQGSMIQGTFWSLRESVRFN
ncbi:putative beta-Fructufuranosidase [Knufia peltigerae]|uniref:Beta-Fructufuranosidase n=1 Tax=Knufia peltigerae TaxID=1002370 RepID=A0AA38Y3X1_9EURO|nr:putative beta-Fructufuranosidase [Knufia peltigerae]